MRALTTSHLISSAWPVKNDAGEISMSKEAKQNAWAEHYEKLLDCTFSQVLISVARLHFH